MVRSSRQLYRRRRKPGGEGGGLAPWEKPVVGPALGVPVHRAVRNEKSATEVEVEVRALSA